MAGPLHRRAHHPRGVSAPLAASGHEHHADRGARVVARDDRRPDDALARLDDPEHLTDREQQAPLVLLARPLAIGREVETGGQIVEREAADVAAQGARTTFSAAVRGIRRH
ncbi:MAG TPA: hypothetical protein VI006_24680 [Solirubrobacteraceae bacterium]